MIFKFKVCLAIGWDVLMTVCGVVLAVQAVVTPGLDLLPSVCGGALVGHSTTRLLETWRNL